MYTAFKKYIQDLTKTDNLKIEKVTHLLKVQNSNYVDINNSIKSNRQKILELEQLNENLKAERNDISDLYISFKETIKNKYKVSDFDLKTVLENIEYLSENYSEELDELYSINYFNGTLSCGNDFYLDNYDLILQHVPETELSLSIEHDSFKRMGKFIVFDVSDLGQDYCLETGVVIESIVDVNDKKEYIVNVGKRNSKYGHEIDIVEEVKKEN